MALVCHSASMRNSSQLASMQKGSGAKSNGKCMLNWLLTEHSMSFKKHNYVSIIR